MKVLPWRLIADARVSSASVLVIHVPIADALARLQVFGLDNQRAYLGICAAGHGFNPGIMARFCCFENDSRTSNPGVVTSASGNQCKGNPNPRVREFLRRPSRYPEKTQECSLYILGPDLVSGPAPDREPASRRYPKWP